MSTPKSLGLGSIRRMLSQSLKGVSDKRRLRRIDGLLHFLNVERRWALLTPEEKRQASNTSLSVEMKAGLAKAESEAAREALIQSWARATYIRRCAWCDYLNGIRAEKPFTSSPKAETMVV